MSQPARLFALVLLLALALVACPGSEPGTSAETERASAAEALGSADDVDPRVERALAVSEAIEASPDSVEAVLAEHELEIAQFEALMIEIASDATLSAQFEAARTD